MSTNLNDIQTGRRSFIQFTALGAAAVAAAALPASKAFAGIQPAAQVPAFLSNSPLTLPPLPYPDDALEPIISAKTLSFHYGKHHKAYFDNIAKLVANTPFANMSLEELVMASAGRPDHEPLFNNAAQAWNHPQHLHWATDAGPPP